MTASRDARPGTTSDQESVRDAHSERPGGVGHPALGADWMAAGNGAIAAMLSRSGKDLGSQAGHPDGPRRPPPGVAMALQLAGNSAATPMMSPDTEFRTAPGADGQRTGLELPASDTDARRTGAGAPVSDANGSPGAAPATDAPPGAAPATDAPTTAAPATAAQPGAAPTTGAPPSAGAAPAVAAPMAGPAAAPTPAPAAAPATAAATAAAPATAAATAAAPATAAPAAAAPATAAPAAAAPVRPLGVRPAVAPMVTAPSSVEPGAEEVVAAIAAAGTEGQAALSAAVTEQLTALASTVETQQTTIDEGSTAQIATVDSAFGTADERIVAAIAAAQQRLFQAHEAERQRLAAWSALTQTRLAEGFTNRADRIHTAGVTRGDQAVTAADTAGTGASSRVADSAGQARAAGQAKAASPGGADAEAAQARAAAATEVAGDTAARIADSLGDTVSQLRGLGPETRSQLIAQADQIAEQVRQQLPTATAVLSNTVAGAGGQLSQAVTAGSASLAALGTDLTGRLAMLRATVAGAVRDQAEAAKVSVHQAGQQAVDAGQAQHDQAAVAAATLINGVLAGVANRKIRRAAAAKLATELSATVRQGFGDAEQQARVALAQIAQAFSDTANQALDVVQAGAEQGRQQATQTAVQGEAAAAGHVAGLTVQMSALVGTAIGTGDGSVNSNIAALDALIADLDSRFGQALAEFRQSLSTRSDEAVGQAREPLGSLDGRMSTAMREAEEATHRSWLENAVRSIPWGAIAGVVVGLVVTIAVVALLGTGIGALIVAGALAGALSAAATTLTTNAIQGRDTDWGELGTQMLVGAVFGAIGGALGGGAAGALGGAVERQLLTEASAIAIGKAANVVTGATLGVVNNVIGGRPWHEGLLVNIGLSMAMTYGPGGRFIENVTNNARSSMVDSGNAFNVTPAEGAASTARLGARTDTPEANVAADAVPASPQGSDGPVPDGPVADGPTAATAGPDGDGIPLSGLPEGTVMYADTPLTEPQARAMYENARRDGPYNEVAIFRNGETGECIVVQGGSRSVDHRFSANKAMLEFMREAPDTRSTHWDLVEHSHPMDPYTGVTRPEHRYPSGRNGDFDVARGEAQRNQRPVEQSIGIVTEHGNDTIRYGFDPQSSQPYWLTAPGPDGAPVTHRFATLDEYGAWYAGQPGAEGRSPHVSAVPEFTGAAAPGGAGDVTVTDLKRRAWAAAERAEEVGRGDWTARAETLRDTFAELDGIATTPDEIRSLVADDIAALEQLESEIPARAPEFAEGANSPLAQPGGLMATEGDRIPLADGGLSEPSHALREHGPDVDPNWLRGMARTSGSGMAAKYTDRAVMEAVTGEALAAAQPQIDAWLAGNPAPGSNLPLPSYDAGRGNLGQGFYRNPATGVVEPMPATMPLTHVRIVLKATGLGPPARPFIIQTSYPSVP
jgi:hypothetical protein